MSHRVAPVVTPTGTSLRGAVAGRVCASPPGVAPPQLTMRRWNEMCSISQNDEFCPRRLGSGRLWKIATVGPITTQGVASWVRLDFCRSSEHLTDELSIPEGTVAQIEAHESCSSAPSFFQQCRSHTICYRICPSASGHLEKTKKIKIKVKNIAKVYYSFEFAYTECPLRERSDLSQASSPR